MRVRLAPDWALTRQGSPESVVAQTADVQRHGLLDIERRSMRRLPLVLAAAAILSKLAAAVSVRTSPDAASPLLWLVFAESRSVLGCERMTGLAFDQRRLWPTLGEALGFDAVLVLVTGAQWYLCGIAIQWLRRRRVGSSARIGAS
jgi:hypothetical protein